MPISTIPSSRLEPVWLAIDPAGKIIGKVSNREFITSLHRYVDELGAGIHSKFPPVMQHHGVPCRYERVEAPPGQDVPILLG